MKPKILLQLDTDAAPSVFDAVVAIDAGADHLLRHGAVDPKNVVEMVHGAIFTRGPEHLQDTIIFVGGSDLSAGEAVVEAIKQTMFDPLRVSVVLDSSGANSTAVAAIQFAAKHLSLEGCKAVVLGATGPVGKRVCMLLASQNASHVSVVSRQSRRAENLIDQLHLAIVEDDDDTTWQPVSMDDSVKLKSILAECDLIFACGAAGVELLSEKLLKIAVNCKVAVDLNAVAPAGIAGIQASDKAVQHGDRVDYGALAVGGLKMKIHKAAIKTAFEQRGLVIDAAEMFQLAGSI